VARARCVARGAARALVFGAFLLPAAASALEGRVPKGRVPLGAPSQLYQKAVALDLAGRYEAALDFYEDVARRPGPARARAQYHRDLTRGLLKHLEHVRRFPQDGRSHFSIGVDAGNKLAALLRETGVVARALFSISERALRKAMRLLPGHADPIVCLAGLYADAGERGKARATIALIRGRTLNVSESYNLACYYHSMGEYDRALEELAKVMNDYYRKWIARSDDFYRLRGDPRFEALMRGTKK
jgi:tetratricopeptide (TPR) repeat protein